MVPGAQKGRPHPPPEEVRGRAFAVHQMHSTARGVCDLWIAGEAESRERVSARWS